MLASNATSFSDLSCGHQHQIFHKQSLTANYTYVIRHAERVVISPLSGNVFHMTLTALMPQMTTGVEFGIPEWNVADRLRKSRDKTGLDQIEFANLIGASKTSVGHWEAGRRIPRPIYLRAWAVATGVTVEWLETGKAPIREDEGLLCAPGT